MNRLWLRRLAEPLMGIDRRRPMAPFARQTFAEMVAERTEGRRQTETTSGAAPAPTGAHGPPPEPADAGPVVAYFYDLYANYNEPDLALVVESVLAAHGVRVLLPEQWASGIPEMLYGYAGKAQEVAQFNIRAVLPLVRAGAALLSSEPTATFAFKVHYPDYLSSSECSLVANATCDLGEFLVRYRADHPEAAPAAGPLRGAPQNVRPRASAQAGAPAQAPRRAPGPGRPLRIAYHQPCHLKAQQIGDPGLELLREIPGVEVIDLAAGCCGMAGTFGMKAGTYDFSMLTGRPLFDRITEVAPDLVASECSTCRMQIAQGTGLQTVHPVRLLAGAYGLGA
jgi:glycerol-3-phosphate dehydrogenase subunit C